MKYLHYLLLLLTFPLMGQSPFYTINSRTDQIFTKQLSLASTWIGSELAFAINDDGSLDNNFIFSARILNIAYQDPKITIPIVGNIALNNDDLFARQSGINLGIFPYSILSSKNNRTIVVHGGLNYKLIPKSLTEETSETQFKILAGIEIALGESLPTTFSITPFYGMHNVGEDSPGIEVTSILPLGNGLGLLANYQKWFKSSFTDSFQIGVIVNSQL